MQDNKTQIIYCFNFAATEAFLIISSNIVIYEARDYEIQKGYGQQKLNERNMSLDILISKLFQGYCAYVIFL